MSGLLDIVMFCSEVLDGASKSVLVAAETFEKAQRHELDRSRTMAS
jgi:hypothetical protein